MATIDTGRKLMTLVNVFTVSPDKQNELADLLRMRKSVFKKSKQFDLLSQKGNDPPNCPNNRPTNAKS